MTDYCSNCDSENKYVIPTSPNNEYGSNVDSMTQDTSGINEYNSTIDLAPKGEISTSYGSENKGNDDNTNFYMSFTVDADKKKEDKDSLMEMMVKSEQDKMDGEKENNTTASWNIDVRSEDFEEVDDLDRILGIHGFKKRD